MILWVHKVPFPQSFNVGSVNFIPGNIINIPVAMATTLKR